MSTSTHIKNGTSVDFLLGELQNFQDIARFIKPNSGEIPEIPGIDIYGEVIPYNGVVGGDHIIYLDFSKRYDLEHRIKVARQQNLWDIAEKLELNKRRAGVLVADVAGHRITDALLSAMLHQAFLTGVQYELKQHGEVTSGLFEILNTRFFNSSKVYKFITMIYGEIWDDGHFRFVNAGHPPPVVFSSRYDKLVDISFGQVVHFPPIGTLPSSEDVDQKRNISRLGYKRKYSVNELNLMGQGDILLLYTDGLSEHGEGAEGVEHPYYPGRLQSILKEVKRQSAQEIFFHIKEDLAEYAKQGDDISFVVIKKN